MKVKLLLLLLTCCFACAAVHAGNCNKGPDPANKKKKDFVNGIVSHATNKRPLKDVLVTAYLNTDNKKEISVQTDEAGNYSFDGLKPGTYKLVFEKTGFRRVTKEKIIIKEEDNVKLNIDLAEISHQIMMPSPLHFSEI
ncbi:carboxypeptidase-like regulatory domain-containing protein [Terrimonas rubra]|uniref:Carboxypeptidase-like regulatory domain-containing protein n=1 Tax=Terrimonas rubra TaxID=1035890 RepID=A0ABW6A5T6_9BACT